MSGIAGIFNVDGAPVDRRLIDRMTAFLRFRGPAASRVWTDGPLALGHTLLPTTDEAEREQQPCSIDGRTWIVADARVGARTALRAGLSGRGRRGLDGATDPELILHAYGEWGEACVEHLLGDFAFAIWDGARRRLFCARDHLGVRPFFYAHIGRTFVFSNTLDCVRLHSSV